MLSDRASLSSLVAFMVLMCVKLAVLICFWFGVPFTCNVEREEKDLDERTKRFCYHSTKRGQLFGFHHAAC